MPSRGPDEVERRAVALYGGAVQAQTGVLHVTAVWRSPSGELRTLRITPATPRSETDAFVLALARARADAIVTTGKILRDEPELSHAIEDAGLLAWRRERVGRSEPARSVVLTSGREIDWSHPILRGGARVLLVTSHEGARRLEDGRRAAVADVEVMARQDPGLRDTVLMLRRDLGCATIAVEAGPSTSRQLYRDPALVDELLLSVYEEPDLPAEVCGEASLEPDRIAELFGPPHHEVSRRERSGRWSFRRYLRKRPRA